MALVLTEEAELLSQQTNVSINIILEIDGFTDTHIFGAVEIRENLMFDEDDVVFDGTYSFDGGKPHDQSKAYISLGETTNNITQQISIDKGVESIKSFTVSLVDLNDELTELFMPGNIVPDILGRKAKVYLNMVGSEHPNDSVQIMEGVIGTAVFKPGLCNLTIDHSSQLKRQDLFAQATTLLNGSINNSVTTINCDDTSDFLTATDVYTTYIRIDDEIMQYTSHTDTSFTAVRGQLGTANVEHDDDAEILSVYRLQGDPITLALKLMLSGGGYGMSSTAETFVALTGDLTVANGIHFSGELDLENDYGLTAGDSVTVAGSTSNNGTYTIDSFGKSSYGSYIVITGGTLTTETEATATVSFKSQYDTLPDGCGCGMTPDQVDIAGHLYWLDLFSGSFPDMDFYLDETVDFNEFLQQELYRPVGLYGVPGKRSSVKMTIPPLADLYMKTLDESNVKNPNNIAIKRSITKYFYNSIVYKFDTSSLDDDKFLAGIIVINADSGERIGYGNVSQPNKPFKVESRGLRQSTAVNSLLNIQAKRFLDRYKFAAEHLDIECFFSTGFVVEVGDVIAVEGLSITDTEKGSRDFGPRLFEVMNKSLSLSSGNVKLSLLSTSYGVDGRWGVISPSSKVDSGATTTNIPLTSSFGFSKKEREKWLQHINQNVLVHDDTWTFAEEVTFTGFLPSAENTMIVSPALSSPPSSGYIVDIPNYDVTTTPVENQILYKTLYCYSQPSLAVDSAIDTISFNVSSTHAAFIKPDSIIEIADSTWTTVGEAVVSSITSDGGTEIVTLKKALSFTPAAGYEIQLVSWLDGGRPYRIL